MPAWIRQLLIVIMLISCVIIGARLYLELQGEQRAEGAGTIATAPEHLPEFILNDVWGEPQSIGSWSGEALLINFWATWCAPCRREMPLLQALHNERADTGITVIGIAIDRQPDVASYITESGISYPILVGEEDAMAVSDMFGLEGLGLPFTVLSTADGQILTVYIGELVAEQLATMATVSQGVAAGSISIAAARQQLAEL